MVPHKVSYKRAVILLVARHGIASFATLKRSLKDEHGLNKGNLLSAALKKLIVEQQLAKEGASYRLGEKAKDANTTEYQEALSAARDDRADNAMSKMAAQKRERTRVAQRLKQAGGLTLRAKRDRKEFNILS